MPSRVCGETQTHYIRRYEQKGEKEMGMSTKAYSVYKELKSVEESNAKIVLGTVVWMRSKDQKVTTRSIMSALGWKYSKVYTSLKTLVDMELLVYSEDFSITGKKTYVYVVNEKGALPASWNPLKIRTEAETAIAEAEKAQKIMEDVKTKEKEETAQKIAEENASGQKVPVIVGKSVIMHKVENADPSDNALTRAMGSTFRVSQDDVDAYQRFIVSMQHVDATTGELQEIVEDCIKLARKRIKEANVPCPACGKGRVERAGVTGAVCVDCRARADSGISFELSMKMLKVLSKVKA